MNYSFDIKQSFRQLIPPKKRFKNVVAFFETIAAALQWSRDMLFDVFKVGATESDYNPLTTYNAGDRVKYTDRGIYECYVNGTLGVLPTSSSNWILVNDSFIGIDELVRYNSQKLILEYALNKWFGTNFVQPDTIPRTSLPQIYIVRNSIYLVQGYFTTDSGDCSQFSSNTIDTTLFFSSVSASISQFDFTVYFPLATYNALNPNASTREKIVRAFINRYVYAGFNYNIVTY